MSLLDNLLAVLTILTSLLLVLLIIGAAWWLMWKVIFMEIFLLVEILYFQVFLSRFQFIKEILFPPSHSSEAVQKTVSRRKVRG